MVRDGSAHGASPTILAGTPATVTLFGTALITTEPAEYFMLWLKMGFFGGLLIAMPFVLYQVWLFVAPGLYSHEKRFAIPFVLFASLFFFGGALFSHYVAFPVT